MRTGGHHDRILKFPYRGAPQTVGVISKAALASQNSYVVRELAEGIAAGLPSKDYLSEYLAVYYYVLANVRYMRDPRTVELVRSPNVLAKQLKAGLTPSADCDDMTALICALVLSMGGQCRAVTVAFRNMFHNGERQFSHVFAQAMEPRSRAWVTLDPVAADRTKEMMGRVKAVKFWPIA